MEVSRTKTKDGDRVVTKTRTDYDNDQNYKIEYFVDEPDTGGAYEVVACASGFCRTPKADAQYQEDLAALDKKNKLVSKTPRGHRNFAGGTSTEQEGDAGGSSYWRLERQLDLESPAPNQCRAFVCACGMAYFNGVGRAGGDMLGRTLK